MLKAYDAWLTRDPQSANWWYNRIGAPLNFSRVMLLAESALDEKRLAGGLRILSRAALGMTGQNLVWVADVTIARGCLAQDANLVAEAFRRIEEEIRYTTGEGIQRDNSFHQHGEQLYSGGYGRGFAADCARLARLAHGTAFEFNAAKVDILSAYVLDGQQWFVRGKTFDFSVCGREISRRGAGSAVSLSGACRDLAALQADHRSEFHVMAHRIEDGAGSVAAFVGNRHFWRSDIMCHHRPTFYASVRMTSSRLLQTETCNAENLHGERLADGVMFLYRRGDEYSGVFPVWDWRRLPGITGEMTPAQPGIRNGQRGKRAFVGGVSDGAHGLAAMQFEREGLTAHKAWFFLDREVVCLGSGITSKSENPVVTCVNQCLLRGDVQVAQSGEPRVLPAVGDHVFKRADWVHHDDVGYVFSTGGRVTVSCAPRTGTWHDINRQYPETDVSLGVFGLRLEHGVRADGEAYVYAVVPGVPVKELAGYVDDVPYRIVCNRPDLQAVAHPGRGFVGAVFGAACDLPSSHAYRLAVDRPCLVLLREIDGALLVAVAEPTGSHSELTVALSGRREGEGASWNARRGKTEVRFALPGGELAGSTVTRQLINVSD